MVYVLSVGERHCWRGGVPHMCQVGAQQHGHDNTPVAPHSFVSASPPAQLVAQQKLLRDSNNTINTCEPHPGACEQACIPLTRHAERSCGPICGKA